MKKEDASGLVVFALIIAVAIVFGLTVLREYSGQSGMSTWEFVAFIGSALIVGVIINAILLEVGHVLGAKAGRYAIISVNILYFTFFKEASKWKFKFSGFDGLTGETKIYPKDGGEKPSNPSPYLLLPTVIMGTEALLCVVGFVLLNATSDPREIGARIAYFLATVAIIAAMILLYNIVPFKLDSMNDGYRLRTVSNPKNREAFNELLKVEYAVAEGKNDVEIKTLTEITEYTANLNLNKVYLLLDENKFKEAEEIIDIILNGKDNLSNATYIRARSQKIYINLMDKTLEEAKIYYEENVPMEERRAISADVSMPSIRTYLLMSGLLDKSRSECLYALAKLQKAYKRTPSMRRHTEMTLFNAALTKVHEAHPKWNLIDYKMIDTTK